MTQGGTSKSTAGGTTQLFEFEPKLGAGQDLEHMLESWLAAVKSSAGHIGVGLFRPCHPDRSCYRVVLQFDSADNLERWQASDQHREHFSRCCDAAVNPPASRVLAGVEALFDLDPATQGTGYAAHVKMTLLMFAGMFPANIIVHHAMKNFPVFLELPALANAALITLLVVILSMYVMIPILRRLLHRWL